MEMMKTIKDAILTLHAFAIHTLHLGQRIRWVRRMALAARAANMGKEHLWAAVRDK
jgi:DNA-binding phage protein